MSVSSIGPNPLAHDLFKQRRDATSAMEQAVQSGGMSGAQQALSVAPLASRALQSPSASTIAATGGGFAADLQSLLSAAQSGNASAALNAAQSLSNDIAGAQGGAGSPSTSGAPQVGGHGRHHHHHVDADGDNDGASAQSASSTGSAGAASGATAGAAAPSNALTSFEASLFSRFGGDASA
ncbi:MAG: hypothetical protein KGM42_10200 [Hyphomicrobiales bacterium]|nr:hypothetical protein [Hyphomicrobiales bacterium]